MLIVIDLQGLQNGSRGRGIGRYVKSLTRAIIRNRGPHEIFLMVNALFQDSIEGIISEFDDLIPRENIIVFYGVGPASELEPQNHWRQVASELMYEKLLIDLKVDAVLIGSLFEGAMDNSIISIGRFSQAHVTAVILYDLIPLMDPEKYIGWAPLATWYYRKIEKLKRADIMLAISESSRSEALQHLALRSDHVVTISTAASDEFHEAKAQAEGNERFSRSILSKYNITKKFLMHTSAFEGRKNFEGLLKAFARMPSAVRKDYQLVLVFKADEHARRIMNDLASSEGLSAGDVVLTGFVPDDELIALYTNCALFVFPSFHEGFGLPALEAMACGACVIGANNSSIIEVIGREDALFDAHSISGMTAAIQRALTDDSFRQELKTHGETHAASFSWDHSARAAIVAIEQANLAAAKIQLPAPEVGMVEFAEQLSRSTAGLASSEQDFVNLARALSKNEESARIVRARAHRDKTIDWRIEGPFDSSYSLALVNRETARALDQLGHNVILHSTEGPGDIPVNHEFLQRNADIAKIFSRETDFPPSKVQVTTRNLFPPRVHDMVSPMRGMHHYPWEETGFPQEWGENFNTYLTFVTCASDHVKKTMQDNGVIVPLITTGNGIDHWDRITASPSYRVKAKRFRFLHVSSCFPRKGVDILLEAFGKAFSSRDDVTLIIKTFANPHNEVAGMIDALKQDNPHYPDIQIIFDDLPESDLKALYEQSHVLVAPSMAEGFGLPIAEAMMSYIPAIVTGWSGQLDFCNESNSWLVDYQFERAKTHFHLFNSAWAKADVDDLCKAMMQAAATSKGDLRAMGAAGRAQLLADHKWSDVAARLVNATAASDPARAARHARIGLVTTWKSKCGIATYSGHLAEYLGEHLTIFAAKESGSTGVDDDHCIRSWQSGKHVNGLKQISGTITEKGLDALIIQFNYSFFNHDELAQLIADAKNQHCAVIMILHSTNDPVREIPGAELYHIVDSLRLCDRLLVHSVNDLNRLKAIGLVDNVTLFPHGVLRYDESDIASPSVDKSLPLVSTFGFFLPHKGLPEIVQAAAILRDRGTPVRFRLLTAEYPVPESTQLIGQVNHMVRELGLEDLVEIRTEFTSDQESLVLLAQSDVTIFAYQHTGESASGAVRYGLAAKRPVMVTPLAIFDDLDDAVFRFSGTRPEDLATGISSTLTSIANDDEQARSVAQAAENWRLQHDYAAVGKRLHNICKAIAFARPDPAYRFHGSSLSFTSEVGSVSGRAIQTTARKGTLLKGPNVRLAVGRYRLAIFGVITRGHGEDVALSIETTRNGVKHVRLHDHAGSETGGLVYEGEFVIAQSGDDFTISLSVSSQAIATISEMTIIPAADQDSFHYDSDLMDPEPVAASR